MTKTVYKSKCCNAGVKVEGLSDFLGSKKVCTVNYVCLECNKPCDAEKSTAKIRTALEEKQEILITKKRIIEEKKWLDFQSKVLQKLVKFFDGIIIDPTNGVILTPKKKRQLAKFQKIKQRMSKSKAKRSR